MIKVLEAADRVRRERIRGASWSMSLLARAIVEDEEEGRITCSDADRIASIITSANRTMAPLYNLARIIVESCSRGEAPGDAARRVLWYMDEARKRLYSLSELVVRDGARIVTLSYSSAVEIVLTPSSPSMVYVAESLPGGEGLELARHLRRLGKPVSLVPDSSIPHTIRESDIVLLGADAVTLDPCLFNKVGSLAAALAAHRYGRPLVSVFESFKIHPDASCSDVEVEVRMYRVDGWGDVVYRVFDSIEGELVSAALTEHGLAEFTGDSLRASLYKFYDLVSTR